MDAERPAWRWRTAGVLASALTLSTSIMAGHHSPVLFDQSREMRLIGVVARVDWRNPHVSLHLGVRTESGAIETWEIEAQSPRVMTLFGWSPASLQTGEAVTILANPSRETGQRSALGRTVITADGAVLQIPWRQAQIRDALRDEQRRQR